MRLDKYLSERTQYSRSQIKRLVFSGKITVNGNVVKKADTSVDDADEIKVSGKSVRTSRTLTLIMNKPAGVVSATEDKVEKTVIDLLPEEYKGQNLSPVGRLDKDTTGLLLLTNDGDLLHRLTSPRKHVPKYYVASLARPFTAEMKAKLAEGVVLKDGTVCQGAQAEAFDRSRLSILICIHEGKYHQVKRMLAAVGNHVEKLRRVGMGGLYLSQDLPEGETAVLLDKDLLKLLNSEDKFSSHLQRLMKCSS